MLGKLFKEYSDLVLKGAEINEDQQVIPILTSLEMRWAKADQDFFIMSLFLNPWIRMSLFNQQVMTGAVVTGAAIRLYTRLFQREPSSGFVFQLLSYKERTAEFSDEAWNLEFLRKAFQSQVRTLSNYRPCIESLATVGFIS